MRDWLEQTAELQATSFGRDLADMTMDEQIQYIKDMLLALEDEAHEALNEISWKPWQAARFVNRKEFISELVDLGHFLANCLVAVGCTDDEWWEAYGKKMQVNRERQTRAGGYQSVAGVDKCELCRRSFDDVGKSDALENCCLKCEREAYMVRKI